MADKPENQSCANCRYYQFTENVPQESGTPVARGRCRRFPPVLQPRAEEQTNWAWFPRVGATLWCGEWSAANPETMDDAATVLARNALAGDVTAARALADKLRE